MCRIRIAIRSTLVSPGGQMLAGGPPQVERAQDVVFRPGWNSESTADRSRPLPPCEENRRWIVDDCLLKCQDAGFVGLVIGRMTDGVERCIHLCVAIVPKVVWCSGVPEEKRSDEVRPLNVI